MSKGKWKRGTIYCDDDELVYEIILSKGKGTLTKKAENMLLEIANNFMYRKKGHYKDPDDWYDILQYGIYVLLTNWYKFNERKYYKALPYFTELMKRAMALQWNELRGIKKGAFITPEFVSWDVILEKNKNL